MIAAESIVVRRIVGEAGRVRCRASGGRRTLADHAVRSAIVLRITHTEFQILEVVGVELIGAVDLGPLLGVFYVDELIAENETERNRNAAGCRRGVVGSTQVPARRRPQ